MAAHGQVGKLQFSTHLFTKLPKRQKRAFTAHGLRVKLQPAICRLNLQTVFLNAERQAGKL